VSSCGARTAKGGSEKTNNVANGKGKKRSEEKKKPLVSKTVA